MVRIIGRLYPWLAGHLLKRETEVIISPYRAGKEGAPITTKSIVLKYNHILMLSILLFYFADTRHLKETFKLELKVDFKITKIVPVPL